MEKLKNILDKLVESHKATEEELITILQALKASADPELMDGLDVLVKDNDKKNRLREIRADLLKQVGSLYNKLVEKPKDEPKK